MRVIERPRWANAFHRGVSVLELLLLLVLILLAVGVIGPAFLTSREDALRRECSIRLAVIRNAKQSVFEEMNRILPADHRLRITDRLNDLHIDKVATITMESPWRFHPEDPCEVGGQVFMGATFLDVPTTSEGIPIAVLENLVP